MAIVSKPTTAYSVTSDSLWPTTIVHLTEGTGNPNEIVKTVTGSFTSAFGGVTTPPWVTDSTVGGACLSYAGGTVSSGVPGDDKELHFTSAGVKTSDITSGITLFAVYRHEGDNTFNGAVIVSANGQDCGIALGGGNTPRVQFLIGASGYEPSVSPQILTANHTYGIVVTCDNASPSNANYYVYDYTTSTRLTDKTRTIGAQLEAYVTNGTASDLIINPRYNVNTYCLRGRLGNAGYYRGIWNSTQINAFFSDPWEAVRATITLSPTTVASGTSATTVTATANTAFYTAGTPGSPTFTNTPVGPKADGSISSQVVNSTTQATLQIIPGSTGGVSTIGDGRATASLTVSATPASTLTLSGPSTGTAHTATSNYTVTADGTLASSEVLTPTSNVGSDTFSPTSVTLTTGSPSATFVLNGISTGARNVNVTRTSGPVLTGPSNVVTTLSAGTLTMGNGTLVSVTDTTIQMSIAAPTGGDGLYTPLKVYRSLTSGFTPGSGTLIDTISSPTFPYVYTDTDLTKWTPYYYIFTITDAASTVGTSIQLSAATYPAKRIGYAYVGQSHSGFMPDIKSYVLSSFTDPSIAPYWTTSNQGVPGSYTNQWLPGQSNYTTAVSNMNAAFSGHSLDVIYVRLEFGVNDANGAANSASTFETNLLQIIGGLQTPDEIVTGVPVVILLSAPIPAVVPSGCTQAQFDRLSSYLNVVRNLADGSTIIYLGDDWYDWCINNPSYYASGGLHLTQSGSTPVSPATTYGYNVLGLIEAHQVARMLSGASVHTDFNSLVVSGIDNQTDPLMVVQDFAETVYFQVNIDGSMGQGNAGAPGASAAIPAWFEQIHTNAVDNAHGIAVTSSRVTTSTPGAATQTTGLLLQTSRTNISTGITDIGRTTGVSAYAWRNHPDDAGNLAWSEALEFVYGHGDLPENTIHTTNVFGIRLVPAAIVGTVDNMYDLFISTIQTGGTVGSHYPIYQEQTGLTNYFGSTLSVPAISYRSQADSSAANGTTYYSTTQSKLAFKDFSGVVHVLY